MQQLNIPAGTPMLIGAPTPPPPQERTQALLELVASSRLIKEAHLPRCFAPSMMKEPGLVLVVIFEQAGDMTLGLKELDTAFPSVMGAEGHIQVWALLSNDPLLDTLRQAKCRIFPA